ncbi:YL1 nuclear protein C-terminal domain-containing protein [Fimicolochytrium jonesii]|uniref:YL1 nuclear protein C-terminal domain-containing protein n=1 Tax=Fimicolochytrium jonesii TaxID=1396493 RepID=UPI0022FEE474|nr:YL1 nuclear protein C-terminal domain-containing protein [Fimicolochytrium jonesii]KAI8823779.1 YL1 nuclear protein C-terminal domain-containing protein [Fimicolochytrium jonesii]
MAKSNKTSRSSGGPAAKRAKLDDTATPTSSPPHSRRSSDPPSTRHNPQVQQAISTAEVVQRLEISSVAKPFKSASYVPPKAIKKLKQMAALERMMDVGVDFPTYWSIQAPPSLMPQKKYCDITGLEAPYTDPKTSLRYHNSDVYQFIRTLQPQHVQMYLELRNAAVKL